MGQLPKNFAQLSFQALADFLSIKKRCELKHYLIICIRQMESVMSMSSWVVKTYPHFSVNRHIVNFACKI